MYWFQAEILLSSLALAAAEGAATRHPGDSVAEASGASEKQHHLLGDE